MSSGGKFGTIACEIKSTRLLADESFKARLTLICPIKFDEDKQCHPWAFPSWARRKNLKSCFLFFPPQDIFQDSLFIFSSTFLLKEFRLCASLSSLHINIMIYISRDKIKKFNYRLFSSSSIERTNEEEKFLMESISLLSCRQSPFPPSTTTTLGIIKLRLFGGDGAAEKWVRLYQRGAGKGVDAKEEAARREHQTAAGCDE